MSFLVLESNVLVLVLGPLVFVVELQRTRHFVRTCRRFAICITSLFFYRQERQYCHYSQGDFAVFLPEGAIRSTIYHQI